MRNPNPYILDDQAQANLKNGINSIWQAHAIIELISKSAQVDDNCTLISALNGVLELMSNGLNDLAEV
ncbi:hypothetical protein EDC44_10921 [Cricetibacter osteomyelitidis]|uniref:Uncharacterized protein n=1 Tax=Cricetibacter osteomyelitidis TaxID=1521931 RepID=A0A4R2SZX3_9PAST|nr:hypothetical protein [Cricetibacter osteomyelitidis]TCP95330.1 hypothetical protein EDC44_10921 [Cricetibacter osteomyelitidis]